MSTYPTEFIDLPSKGLNLYPSENPLSKGVIELKYMTAKHEDILTNQNYLKQGTVIDILLKELIVTPINYDDLLLGDKDAVMIASRILAYGSNYEFNMTKGGINTKFSYDLSKLEAKQVDPSLYKGNNLFSIVLPLSGKTVDFKLLTHGDEKNIDAETKAMKKFNPNYSSDVTTRLKYMIVAIDNDTDRNKIREFVEKELTSRDSLALKKAYAEVNIGIDMTVDLEKDGYIQEGVQLPIDITFFWPE